MTNDADKPTETLVPSTKTLLPDSTESDVKPFHLPDRIGRYRIIRILGEGSFGRVYLGHDEILDRTVAIKVPRLDRVNHPDDVESYLTEARVLTKLDHPGIVPVFDADRTDDGLCFVVSKFIEGSDLARHINQTRPSHYQAAEFVATIAEALHHAHLKGLVHRDIKPANILIDQAGKLYVADFGLALKDVDFGKGSGFAGTPAYMSPEQARSEGHRVDGRSDIFSLGVVFYEMLTGKRPFRSDTMHGLLYQIATDEARPLRQSDDSIPKELERICLKALSKRATERYPTANDMADDLRCFLKERIEPATPSPTTTPSDTFGRPLKIVPKGLRSFDGHDADFFLELLPGPHDRDGLPTSVRFWKTRIEEKDDQTFAVGLIYGPSGCGKSSLVKAGLLPRLRKQVRSVYVEATPDETESRLLSGLRKVCSELPPNLGLVESLAALRQSRVLPSSSKVLIILDQFEQWLHAKRGEENTDLVTALRHCDGRLVQTIVMVRDDFWLAASRFMRALEIRLVEGENSALVDLFDPRHSKKVLTAFGRAYGALPDRVEDFSSQQQSFLDQAITGLARDGKVVSVRLSLFAEMLKGKIWTPTTLKDVGGIDGIGVTFLEETFSNSTAPPEHRLHQKAARLVLRALLPESGTEMKGQMRSREALLEASGYAAGSKEFDNVIRILDGELRLITPTDPDAVDSGEQPLPTTADRTYYQLTHDYLVPSLRDWLTRKQRETRKGRAQLRLAETAQLWGANPSKQTLPGFTDFLSILTLTARSKWSLLERRMMRAATRKHRVGLLSALILITASCVAPYTGYQYISTTLFLDEFSRLGNQDYKLSYPTVLRLIDEMKMSRIFIDPILQSRLTKADRRNDATMTMLYSAALLPTHPGKRTYFYDLLRKGGRDDYDRREFIVTLLKLYDPYFGNEMWKIAENNDEAIWRRYFAVSQLADVDPLNPKWPDTAADIIAHHDFTDERALSFSPGTSLHNMSSLIIASFTRPLLKKIERSRESVIPVELLIDLFPPEEALTRIVDGYLMGYFSLESFDLNIRGLLLESRYGSTVSDAKVKIVVDLLSSNKYPLTRRELAIGILTGKSKTK